MLYTSYFTSVCTELFLFILNIIHNIPLYSLIKSSWHFFIILSGEKMSSKLSHGACLYLHNWSSWVHVFCMSICFTVCFYIDLWFTVWLDYFIREYMLIILLPVSVLTNLPLCSLFQIVFWVYDMSLGLKISKSLFTDCLLSFSVFVYIL